MAKPVSVVALSASNFAVLAADPTRNGFNIYNNGTVACYLTFGPTSTLATFGVKLVAAGGFYNSQPYERAEQVSGISDASPSGSLMVTEF